MKAEEFKAKYFTLAELTHSTLAKANGIDNTPYPEAIDNLQELTRYVLDPLRALWGQALTVNSGYRSRWLNKCVGGAANSQHMRGSAADITTGDPETNRRLLGLLLYHGIRFDQLIAEQCDSKGNPKWLHISYNQVHNRYQLLFT